MPSSQGLAIGEQIVVKKNGAEWADEVAEIKFVGRGEVCWFDPYRACSMPVHHGSRSKQDERFPPPRPERSKRNPEQLVPDSNRVSSVVKDRPRMATDQDLSTCCSVPRCHFPFEDEVFTGAKELTKLGSPSATTRFAHTTCLALVRSNCQMHRPCIGTGTAWTHRYMLSPARETPLILL